MADYGLLKIHDDEDDEVNIVGDLELQHVEVEYIPIDVPIDTVVETASDGLDNFSILGFNGLTEPVHEVVLHDEPEIEW